MVAEGPSTKFVFPRWANYLLLVLVVGGAGGALYVPVLFGFGASPRTLYVGYQPEQPVAYSHALHAGKLGIDCRYCHIGVEKGPHATLPATQTCMNCHSSIKTDSPNLVRLRESWATGKPVEWVRVHDLPDYVYFNHSAHVNRGVGCASCHGRIDQMDVVQQAMPLSMGWCLDCHRNPEKNLRPISEITNMAYKPEPKPDETAVAAQLRVGNELKQLYHTRDKTYMTSCSTCHR